jgi:hypothetical protein
LFSALCARTISRSICNFTLYSIPPTADWLDEIHKGIEWQDAFIFVLSPDSIQAEVCNWECDHAVKNGKRIIPVVCRDVDYREVRKALAQLNWIFFRADGDDFNAAMKLLVRSSGCITIVCCSCCYTCIIRRMQYIVPPRFPFACMACNLHIRTHSLTHITTNALLLLHFKALDVDMRHARHHTKLPCNLHTRSLTHTIY